MVTAIVAAAALAVGALVFVAGCLYEHCRSGGSFDVQAENVALRDMLRDNRAWTPLDDAMLRHPSNRGGAS